MPVLAAIFIGLVLAAQPQKPFGDQLALAAIERTQHAVRYDPAYWQIPYPGGDVPAHLGVCADVVIRSLRAVGIDLQQKVHEDMAANFGAYPTHWGLVRPDPNIDHRRVPNLERYFTRMGASLAVGNAPSAFQPGDIVAWNLRGATGGWLPHIGIVVEGRSPRGRPLVVHNIGAGPKAEDVLFAWPMTGHYRYRPDH